MELGFRKPVGRASARRPGWTRIVVTLLGLTALGAPGVQAQAACEDVSGAWAVDLAIPGNAPQQVTVTLEQTECEVTGLVKGNNETPIEDGSVEGWTFTFTTTRPDQAGQPLAIVWTGTVDGDAVSGTFEVPGLGSVEFSGKRAG
jgi:hypothetical protein